MLTESLRGRLLEDMLAPVEEAEVQALVNIRKIEMRHRDDELYLKVTVRFQYASKASQEPQDGYREIESGSTRRPLEYWLVADEVMIQNAMAECRGKIATEMARLPGELWAGRQG